MNKLMEIDVWKGDWGLASIDFDCLRLVTHCKFAGAPVQYNIKNHTLNSPSGKLPVFKHYQHTFCSFDDINDYLTHKNHSPDFGLTPRQKADTVAFTMFLQEYLHPAILHTWWVDERNRINLSRKWYARALPFPLNFFYPDRFHKQAQDAVESMFPNIDSGQMLENEVYERAMKGLSVVSQRLGTQEFMFGAHPTSLDATLFAYLAPIVKVPFPNAKLKNHLISFNNLLKYVNRISQRYFATEVQAYEAKRLAEQTNGNGPRNTNNIPHKRLNQVLAAAFALIAMTGYAASTGLIQIPENWKSRKAPPRVFKIPILLKS